MMRRIINSVRSTLTTIKNRMSTLVDVLRREEEDDPISEKKKGLWWWWLLVKCFASVFGTKAPVKKLKMRNY